MINNKFVSWTSVELTGGFWKKWQQTVAQNTSRAIYHRFKETGRIEAMKLEWKEGMPNKPHVFWDSDIAKWMEGSAYLLYLNEDKELRDYLETIIGYVESGQNKEGYFNSAFLTLEPDKIFTDRTNHELYTAGHFIEAAVAHFYATGCDHFLKSMMRFADYIEKRFKLDRDTGFKTPGHQELELALVRLYEASGEKRYLELSKYFVDTRGTDCKERVFSVPNGTFPADPPLANQLYYNDTYAQDAAPARELRAAGGHAVRAMYFYTAMADIAREYDDVKLQEACSSLWNDSVNRKMYVTGGVSAERYGEAIGTDYVLPNDDAYAETCASVAMANFSQRMFCIEQDSRYMDMVEKQMYNGALSGLSMDGKGFFYDNALQCRPEVSDFFTGIHALPLLPPYRRQELFECSCCPPNIYRFLAAMGQYFYSAAQDTVSIHQFATGSGIVEVSGKQIIFRQETNYPWEETVKISLDMKEAVSAQICIRLPGWCRSGAKVTVNGANPEEMVMKSGYACMNRRWQPEDIIMLHFPMEIVKMESNPHIVEDAGRIALMRGPLVYCLESVDNLFNIFDLTLGAVEEKFECQKMEIEGYPIIAIKGKGVIRNSEKWENVLYKPYQADREEVVFQAIPYFAWANRAVSDMTVWIKHLG